MGGDLSAAPAGKSPDVPGRRPEGPDRREPRPHPDRQGLAGRQGRRCRRRSTTSSGAMPTSASPAADGKLPPVGNTVDVANATWTNTIGDPELITVWKDPDFDPKQRAFYYARVLEIPTPRWTAYDAKRFGIQPLPGTTMTLQERAYTSPIWYTPADAIRTARSRCALCASPCCISCCSARALRRLRGAGGRTSGRSDRSSSPRADRRQVAAFSRTWQRPPTPRGSSTD